MHYQRLYWHCAMEYYELLSKALNLTIIFLLDDILASKPVDPDTEISNSKMAIAAYMIWSDLLNLNILLIFSYWDNYTLF